MNEDFTFISHVGTAAIGQLDDLAPLYEQVYAESPYESGPIWQIDEFVGRTQRQATRDGFSLVTVHESNGALVGFSFGLPFAKGHWWSGSTDPVPDDISSSRKFAIIELVVSKPNRGQGVGRRLLDTLLSDRPEPYATLTAVTNADARSIYEHWGWRQIGSLVNPLQPELRFDILVHAIS
ncbi:GNAT family N-acetyltransferase [Dactylosporangium sp. McL0621]|uniref:GNAT family N-acetyltransferase n=1 Tax=Dactylosporangium sp. McL0621 TaxID=3415678 RepID=UPI003CF506FF